MARCKNCHDEIEYSPGNGWGHGTDGVFIFCLVGTGRAEPEGRES